MRSGSVPVNHFPYLTRSLRCNCTPSADAGAWWIFIGSLGQGVISTFSTRHNTRPHPLMYVAGHSSQGPASFTPRPGATCSPPASRSVWIFISARPSSAAARCQRALTSAHFEWSEPTDTLLCHGRFFFFSCLCKPATFLNILRLKAWIAMTAGKLEVLFSRKHWLVWTHDFFCVISQSKHQQCCNFPAGHSQKIGICKSRSISVFFFWAFFGNKDKCEST